MRHAYLVRGLDVLLVGGHEAVPRADPVANLGVVDLEEQAVLPRLGLPLLRHLRVGHAVVNKQPCPRTSTSRKPLAHLVSRPPDLDELPDTDARLGGLGQRLGLRRLCILFRQ
jgi:hypothetical protein